MGGSETKIWKKNWLVYYFWPKNYFFYPKILFLKFKFFKFYFYPKKQNFKNLGFKKHKYLTQKNLQKSEKWGGPKFFLGGSETKIRKKGGVWNFFGGVWKKIWKKWGGLKFFWGGPKQNPGKMGGSERKSGNFKKTSACFFIKKSPAPKIFGPNICFPGQKKLKQFISGKNIFFNFVLGQNHFFVQKIFRYWSVFKQIDKESDLGLFWVWKCQNSQNGGFFFSKNTSLPYLGANPGVNKEVKRQKS